MVNISERPSEVEDRAVPGHWEGDLIRGTGGSAIGTLVERTSRFTMLIRVEAVDSETVNGELTRHIMTLPEQLRRTLTWDQGVELAQHLQFKIDTGMQVYFCDPTGHVEGPVVIHDPPRSAPTSPEQASGSEIVYVSGALAAWDGAVQQPDGSVDTSGFEQYLNSLAAPPEGPVEVALLLFDLTDDDVDEIEETDSAQGSGTRITLVSDIARDDSVASLRRQVTLDRASDGRWTITEATWGQLCRPGRGHQHYSQEPCV